jgi:hypothetical protein
VRLVKLELRLSPRYSDFYPISDFIVGFWQHGYELKVLYEQVPSGAGMGRL